MRLLVARAPHDAAPLVEQLEARGHDCLVVPLFRVVPQELDAGALEEALGGVQALLFTSANGVRAFAAKSGRRDLTVFAVGDATAAAARDAGFGSVESASGNVEDLAKLVSRRLTPQDGPLFHAAARQVAGDLQGLLETEGFTVRRLVLYEARPLDRLSKATETALRQNRIEAALFFSPRSAASFVRLVQEAGLRDHCRSIEALCLSGAVAEAVAGLAWSGRKVAARPDTSALLDLVDQLARANVGAAERADQSKAKAGQLDDKQDKAADEPEATGQPEDKSEDKQEEAPALAVISAFGGIRPMAAKLGIAVSTVQGWRERAAIPQARHDEILAAAAKHDIDLDAAVLAASDRPQPARMQGAGPDLGQRGPVRQSGASEAGDGQKPEDDGEGAAAERPQAGEDTPEKVPTVVPPTRQGGAGWAFFLLGALVFAAGVVLAVFTLPYWQPLATTLVDDEASSSEMAQRLSSLEASLGELDVQLEQLATTQSAAPDDGDALAALRAETDSLAARLEALEAAGSGAAGADDLAPLTESVERLGQRLSALEERLAQSGGAEQALQAVNEEVAALAARLDAVETLNEDVASLAARLDAVEALNERLDGVDGRLGAMEDRQTELQASLDSLAERSREALNAPGRDAMLALAIAQLRDALRDGTAFDAELRQLRSFSQDDPELAGLLESLAPYAEAGAPTLEALQRRFPNVARSAVAAAQGDDAEGWLGGVLRRVSGVVTVRPVGEVSGDTPGAVVARAEARLEAGDLAGAVAQLEALQGRAAETVAQWREQAEARLAAEQALSQLSAHVISKLGSLGG